MVSGGAGAGGDWAEENVIGPYTTRRRGQSLKSEANLQIATCLASASTVNTDPGPPSSHSPFPADAQELSPITTLFPTSGRGPQLECCATTTQAGRQLQRREVCVCGGFETPIYLRSIVADGREHTARSTVPALGAVVDPRINASVGGSTERLC